MTIEKCIFIGGEMIAEEMFDLIVRKFVVDDSRMILNKEYDAVGRKSYSCL